MTFILPQHGGPNVEGTAFEGTSIYNVIGMYYLSHAQANDICVINGEPYIPDHSLTVDNNHKHDKSCVKLPTDSLYNIPGPQTTVSLRWIEKQNRISVPGEENKEEGKFWRQFNNCSGKNFIALPIGFNCKSYGHANYLFFHKIKKTLERFESFGRPSGACIGNDIVDEKIEELFRENFKIYAPQYNGFTYLKPRDILPYHNVQTIQEAEDRWRDRSNNNPVGFCSVWSLWYVELRSLNPDLDHDELMEKAIRGIRDLELSREIQYGPGSFTDFIRRYSLKFVDLHNKLQRKYDNDSSNYGRSRFKDGGGRSNKKKKKSVKKTKMKLNIGLIKDCLINCKKNMKKSRTNKIK
jgi:hypothetical protein